MMKMDEKSNFLLSCLGLWATFSAAIIIGSVVNGWALTILWGWFIAPIFGLPILTIPQAIGVGMVVTFFTKHAIRTKETEPKDFTTALRETLITIIFTPAFTVGMGYIVSLFL